MERSVELAQTGKTWNVTFKDAVESLEINRSIPLTGKWNPEAWEPCHKIIPQNP